MSKRLAVVARQAGDPQRAALSAAIKESAAARRRLTEHDLAIARGRQIVADAEQELERAAAGVNECRDRHSDELASAIAANAPLPASAAVSRAITAEADAKLALEQAAVGVGRLAQDRRARENAVALADAAVVVEVNKIIAPQMAEMIARAEEALRVLWRSVAVLRGLQSTDEAVRVPDDAGLDWRECNKLNEEAIWPVPPELRERLDHLLRSRTGWAMQFDVPAEIGAVVRRWREARAALRNDPSVPLPPVQES
jgi:hypothetical protein